MSPRTSTLPPRTEKLYPILHVFGCEVCNQFQQATHLLTYRVLLLTDEDDSSMRFVLCHVARMESIEIPDIETV